MPMEKVVASAEAVQAWDAVADELVARGDVTRAPMFGMPSVKHTGGKAFAGLYGDSMTFKLTGDAHAEALALAGAQAFDPSGKRPMKQWVQVPLAHSGRWMELALAAMQTPT